MKTKATKKTKVAKRIDRNAANKAKLIEVLNISEEEYFWSKADHGLEFLDKHFPKEGMYSQLYWKHSENPKFWAWWNLQFSNRIAEFLDFGISDNPLLIHNSWEFAIAELIDNEALNHSFYTNYLKLKNHV